jgi:hypothetical protein
MKYKTSLFKSTAETNKFVHTIVLFFFDISFLDLIKLTSFEISFLHLIDALLNHQDELFLCNLISLTLLVYPNMLQNCLLTLV